MVKLFLAWQDPTSRAWFTVGRLKYDGEKYQFAYTRGAQEAQKKSGFQPLQTFPDLEQVYESDQLFPLFTNRLLHRSRPDYNEYVQWLNLPQDKDDPIALLARSGGRRATDTFEVFPCPEVDEFGRYHIHFFAHGLRHLPQASLDRIERLKGGESLILAHEFQNAVDPRALLMLAEDRHTVGYCPRYLLDDAFEILRGQPQLAQVAVERVNLPPAPLQLRLLCSLTARWPGTFNPFSSDMYQSINSGLAAIEAEAAIRDAPFKLA